MTNKQIDRGIRFAKEIVGTVYPKDLMAVLEAMKGSEEAPYYVTPKERAKLLDEINMCMNKVVDDLRNTIKPDDKRTLMQKEFDKAFPIVTDPIREVYEKWKDSLKFMETNMEHKGNKISIFRPEFTGDMWGAIEQYCEEQ